MRPLSEANEATGSRPEQDPSWASEQVDYLLSETMESALRGRDDADPMRVEVAQSLSTLAGMLLDEGSGVQSRRACEAAVAHLRRAHDVGGDVVRDLASTLVNLAIVCARTSEAGNATESARHAGEAMRWILSTHAEDGTDIDVLLAAASWSARTQAKLDAVDDRTLADLGSAAEHVSRPDIADVEALRTFGFDLTSLATRLAGQDESEGASQVSVAAVVVYRTLADREPERYGPDLATALKNSAVLGERLGRAGDAARDAHEAARWYGRPSERGGPQDDVQAAMLLLAARSALAAGGYADAAGRARDAEAAYRRLADRDGARYAGALQTARALLRIARSGAN